MRTTITAALAASSVLALGQGRASAQAELHEQVDLTPHDGAFEVGVFAGAFIPSEDHEFYDWQEAMHEELAAVGPDLGLRLGYYPLKYVGIEGEADLLPFGTDSGSGALLWGVRAHVIAQFPARVTPFVLGGGGAMGVSSDRTALASDVDKVAHFGAGAKYQVNRWLGLRLEGRLLRAPAVEEDTGTNHFAVLAGASLTLGGGGATSAPRAIDSDQNVVTAVDTDKDGMLDDVDKCPADAETVNAYEDDDGCPDSVPDRDGDGVSDAVDTCPDQPEDVDSFEDTDGCPDLDNDGDGVTDASDRCPTESGPAENRGCADTDRDSDGVVDRIDNCPEEAGTEANHGCKTKQLVVLTQTQLKILDKVYFKTNKSVLDKRSNRLLDQVAAVLINHPEIQRVRIEGHTDDVGPDERNKDLSQRRAEAVVSYLGDKGVAPERLEPVGFGEEKPIATNKNEGGRSQNRRVEFNIVDTPAPTGDRSGSETVRPAGGDGTLLPP